MNTPNPDSTYRATPLEFERLPADEQRARLAAFQKRMVKRRTVRHYSSEQVPDELIDSAIAVAGSAPSGANLQPWRFVVVRDAEVKRRIREAAEEEERATMASNRTARSGSAASSTTTFQNRSASPAASCWSPSMSRGSPH